MAGSDTTAVTVCDGYLVVDPASGEQVGGGTRLHLPAALAEQCAAAGWVEPTKPAPRRSTSSSTSTS